MGYACWPQPERLGDGEAQPPESYTRARRLARDRPEAWS